MSDTLLRIRLFVAAFEERSFTAAATREHATQSGVTQNVKHLEALLGVVLFLRTKQGIEPTPAGRRYYDACVEMLRAHAATRQSINSFIHGLNGEVHVALTPIMTRSVLAPALKEFSATHPNVDVTITDAYSDVVKAYVQERKADFGVVPARPPEGFRSEWIARSAEFLVARCGHPVLQGATSVKLSELGPLRLVLPTAAQSRRALVDDYLKMTGAVIEQRLELDSALGALDLVSQSDWMTLRPGLMMTRALDRVEFDVARLAEPPLNLDLYRIERTDAALTPAALAFAAILKDHTRRQVHQAETMDLAGDEGARKRLLCVSPLTATSTGSSAQMRGLGASRLK